MKYIGLFFLGIVCTMLINNSTAAGGDEEKKMAATPTKRVLRVRARVTGVDPVPASVVRALADTPIAQTVGSFPKEQVLLGKSDWPEKWLHQGEENFFYKIDSLSWPGHKGYDDFFGNLYPLMLGKTFDEAREKRAVQHAYTRRLVEAYKDGNLAAMGSGTPYDEMNRHYIWVNNPEDPSEPPSLEYLIQAYRQSSEKWGFHLWTNVPLPRTQAALAEAQVNIQIHDIAAELYPMMKGKGIYGRFHAGKYFTACSDVVRFNLIHCFGKGANTLNFYTDFHIELAENIEVLAPYIDNLFFQEGVLAAPGCMAARKGSPVYGRFLEIIDDLENAIDPTWRQFGKDMRTPVPLWTAIGMHTLVLDMMSSSTDRVLPVPANTLAIPHYTGSWLKGLHGQTPITRPLPEEVFFGKGDFLLSGPTYPAPPEYKNIELAEIFYPQEDLAGRMTRKREILTQRSRDIYRTLLKTSQTIPDHIPHIFHRVWLTDPDNPKEPDPRMVTRYLQSLPQLPKEGRHIFWCDDEAHVPQTAERLRAAGIEVKQVSDFWVEAAQNPTCCDEMGRILAKHVYEAYRQDKRPTNANDILRRHLELHYGGLYMDMGARVERDMTRLLDGYEYIFYVWDWGLDTSIFGARKGDFLIRADLNFIHTLYKTPHEKALRAKGYNTPLVQLNLTGCNALMALFDTHMPDDARVLFFHPDEVEGLDRAEKWQTQSNAFVSLVHGRSWHGSGEKLKNNKSISDSTLDLFKVKPEGKE